MQQQETLTPLEMIKNDILDVLSEGTHEIIFTKNDGTVRTLMGTREFDAIPDEFKPKSTTVNKGNSIPVFDTEINEWRAFSLTKLMTIDGNEYKEILTEAVKK